MLHYDVRSLAYDSSSGAAGTLTAWGAPITVRREEGNHFTREEHRLLDLAKDVDVILMRQDPPFDLGYITGTHLLERLAGRRALEIEFLKGAQRSGRLSRNERTSATADLGGSRSGGDAS